MALLHVEETYIREQREMYLQRDLRNEYEGKGIRVLNICR